MNSAKTPAVCAWPVAVGMGLSMLVLALCFPRIGWWPLIWVALVPMAMVVATCARLRWLLLLGGSLSLIWWLVMQSWLIQVTGGGWFGLSLAMAIYWTLALGWAGWLVHRARVPLFWALPLAWASVEMIRCAWPFGGYSWFLLAQALAPWREGQDPGRLIQIMDLVGPWPVSLLIVMVNALLATLLLRLWRQGPGAWRSILGAERVGLAVTAGLLVLAMVYGHWRVGQVEAGLHDGPLVAVIQTNRPQDNKTRPTPQSDAQAWEELVDLTMQAMNQPLRPDLILWPETSVPAALNLQAATEARHRAQTYGAVSEAMLERFSSEERLSLEREGERLGVAWNQVPQVYAHWQAQRADYRGQVAELAGQLGIAMLVGAPTELGGSPPQRYNSAYHITPQGAYAARYDKMHRVPFGEYLPLVELAPALRDFFIRTMTPYEHDYSLNAGTDPVVFTLTDGTRLVAPICFEDTVSRLCRRLVYTPGGERRADVMVNLTNDGWYPGTAQGPQHQQIAAMRCIELRTGMARSVNTGPSGLIDPTGRIGPLVRRDQQTQQVAGVVVAPLKRSSHTSLYGWWGRGPMWVVVALTLGLGLGALYRCGKV